MPTSDERREVAARLREDASCSESSPRVAVESYLGVEYDGADAFEESYKSESLLRLADLIDPTCEVDYCRYLYGCCAYEYHLSCGHSVDRPWRTPPAYCPECGARCIAGEGDGDED
jgi:hypothetical protein